jgi:kynurenine formamidase
MERYDGGERLENNRWGRWGKEDQTGVLGEMTPAMRLAALGLVREGRVYDLETLRFKGMPVWPGHSGFDIMAYASPRGRRNMRSGDIPAAYSWNSPGGMLDAEKNTYNMGVNTETLLAPLHAGTHIDALCHWTTGEDDHWYNGYTADEFATNFGPTRCDAAQIQPMVMRGVLLDIAGYRGLPHLPPNTVITPEDCAGCAQWEGVPLREGDAVLLRTGERWPEGDLCPDAGLGVAAARYLVEGMGAFLIGDDMACLDGFHADGSSSFPGHVQPVHHYLLIQQGVHIVELLQLDALARDKVYEFCFICTPTKIQCATGMYVRPIAMV